MFSGLILCLFNIKQIQKALLICDIWGCRRTGVEAFVLPGCYKAFGWEFVRLLLKCDGTRAETRFCLSAKRTSPFKPAGASVQSTAGSRGVRISGSNAGYTMFRSSVKGTSYPLHSPVSSSLPLPHVTVCRHVSIGLYQSSRLKQSRDYKCLCGTDRLSWNTITTPCNIPEKRRPHAFWFVRSLEESVWKTWASCHYSGHSQYQLVSGGGVDSSGGADSHMMSRHHHQAFSRATSVNSGFVYGAAGTSGPPNSGLTGSPAGTTGGYGLRSPGTPTGGGYVPGPGSEFLHHHHHLHPSPTPGTGMSSASHHQAAPPPTSPFSTTSFPATHHQAFYPYGPPQGPYYMSPR